MGGQTSTLSERDSSSITVDTLRVGIEYEQRRRHERAADEAHLERAKQDAMVERRIVYYVRHVDKQLKRFARRLELPAEWASDRCSVTLINPMPPFFSHDSMYAKFLGELSASGSARLRAAVRTRLRELSPLLNRGELRLEVFLRPLDYVFRRGRECECHLQVWLPGQKETPK